MEYNNTIFIGDLSYFCTKRDLEELFCSYGKIVNIRIKQNEGKKKSLSFGFVQFSTHEEAINALNKLNGEMFLGRVLRLGWASDANAKLKKTSSISQDLKSVQILVSFISRQIKLLVTEETLRDICSIYGYVTDATVKKSKIDKASSTQTGYGFVNFENTTEGINSALTAITQLRDCSIDDITYDCGLSDSLKRYFYNLKLQNDDTLERLNIDMELFNKATFGAEVPMNETLTVYPNHNSSNNNIVHKNHQPSHHTLTNLSSHSMNNSNDMYMPHTGDMRHHSSYTDSNYYPSYNNSNNNNEKSYNNNYESSTNGFQTLNQYTAYQQSEGDISAIPMTVMTNTSSHYQQTPLSVNTNISYDPYQYNNNNGGYTSNQYSSSIYPSTVIYEQQSNIPIQQHSSYQSQIPSSGYTNHQYVYPHSQQQPQQYQKNKTQQYKQYNSK